MSNRSWHRCNRRKAASLIEQGVQVMIEDGICYYRRPKNRSKGYLKRQKKQFEKSLSVQIREVT